MERKEWYRSKAVWLGILTLVVSILSFLEGEEWIAAYPGLVAALGTVVGIATVVIRFLTKTPLKKLGGRK